MTDTPARWRARLEPLAIFAALFLLWELAVRWFALPSWLLPAPSEILATARDWAPELAANALVTLRETVTGFALAVAISVPLAVLIAFTRVLRRVLYPILLGLQSVPKVALAPLVTLWLGVGEAPKVVIVVLVCFFPVLVNMIAGLEAAPRNMVDLMRSVEASRWQVFRRLRLPFALPHIFTGCKVAVTFAVIGSVIAEFVAAQSGLGYLILMSTSQSLTPLAFAAILLLTLMSVLLFYLIEWAERRAVTWHM
ncbi:ABC transporter permease [Poseidonocella sp. HB161398]|uniref:ABC transporter permease n=1 Tax=Poseidonocella sp. HB161398 TaxID=2320855 RepID=UPI00110824A6|nr:ABC transporter permease [Poseidonocella sp. HB161398]